MIIHNSLIIKFFKFSLGIFIAMSSFQALAGTAEDIALIKLKLESKTPPWNAKSIRPSVFAGLYEVFVLGNIIYTDSSFSHVLVNGSIIKVGSEKNLTEESLKLLSKINFNDLPFQNAIEIKKGSGNYKFAVFSDPDCPYCKSLEAGLSSAEITNYTAYIFLLPLRDLHPSAADKSESIWCANDKNQTWTNFMLKNTPPARLKCENPITANEKLAAEIGVSGTPTIYLNNGEKTQNLQDLVSAIKANK